MISKSRFKNTRVHIAGNSRLNTNSKHLFIGFRRPHMPAMRGPFIKFFYQNMMWRTECSSIDIYTSYLTFYNNQTTGHWL